VTVNGWTWDERDQYWYAQRGTARVVVYRPNYAPPSDNAHDFTLILNPEGRHAR
jgi:hypothetical protein